MCRRLRNTAAGGSGGFLLYRRQRHRHVALGAGSAALVAFAKAFRRHYGCTPGALRRETGRTAPGSQGKDTALARGTPLCWKTTHRAREQHPGTPPRWTPAPRAYIRVTGPWRGAGDASSRHRLRQSGRAPRPGWARVDLHPPRQRPRRRLRLPSARTDIGISVPVGTWGRGWRIPASSPAGRYAQSRYCSSRIATSTGRAGRA